MSSSEAFLLTFGVLYFSSSPPSPSNDVLLLYPEWLPIHHGVHFTLFLIPHTCMHHVHCREQLKKPILDTVPNLDCSALKQNISKLSQTFFFPRGVEAISGFTLRCSRTNVPTTVQGQDCSILSPTWHYHVGTRFSRTQTHIKPWTQVGKNAAPNREWAGLGV